MSSKGIQGAQLTATLLRAAARSTAAAASIGGGAWVAWEAGETQKGTMDWTGEVRKP